MDLKEMERFLKELDIETDIYEKEIDVINLKEILSSLDFLKLIMYIEEMYAIEFDEKLLNKDTINFLTISEYIKNGK